MLSAAQIGDTDETQKIWLHQGIKQTFKCSYIWIFLDDQEHAKTASIDHLWADLCSLKNAHLVFQQAQHKNCMSYIDKTYTNQ